jgi:hypothetical protein
MSTYWSLVKKIPACDVFDGRLEEFGIREHIVPDRTTDTYRCLTDGREYVWVRIDGGGFFWSVRGTSKILHTVADVFETDIVSEHQAQFWGFDTEEEWERWQMEHAEEGAERNRNEFYMKVCAYVGGEANVIAPGTIWEIKAQIAKKLVEKDPAFLRPENKERLLVEIEAIYDRDHVVKIKLGPEDIAFAQMLATHQDDLPQA